MVSVEWTQEQITESGHFDFRLRTMPHRFSTKWIYVHPRHGACIPGHTDGPYPRTEFPCFVVPAGEFWINHEWRGPIEATVPEGV